MCSSSCSKEAGRSLSRNTKTCMNRLMIKTEFERVKLIVNSIIVSHSEVYQPLLRSGFHPRCLRLRRSLHTRALDLLLLKREIRDRSQSEPKHCFFEHRQELVYIARARKHWYLGLNQFTNKLKGPLIVLIRVKN